MRCSVAPTGQHRGKEKCAGEGTHQVTAIESKCLNAGENMIISRVIKNYNEITRDKILQ